MIIEQVDALKLWLTSKLSPICDAEPSALAKYVCALVKKDKQEQDLRDICVDQLDVFLQQNTRPFVDELFEVLKTKVYISAAPEPKPRPPVVIPVIKQENKSPSHLGGREREKDDGQKKKMSEQISSTTDDKESKDMTGGVTSASSTTAPSTIISSREVGSGDYMGRPGNKDPPREIREHRTPTRDGRDKEREEEASRDRRDTWKDDRNRDSVKDARDIIRDRERDRTDTKLDTREVREPRDRDFRERDRDYRRRRTRSRSYSPRRREFEFDRRRRFEERPRYSPERRWGRRRSWSRSPRRNRSPVDRMERAVVRPRSRSPRLRSRSPRERYRQIRSRSRTPRSRSPRPRSWSRPGSGPRLRTRSLSNTRLPDSRGSTPLQDNDYISSSTNDPPTVTSIVGYRPLAEDRPDSHLPAPYEAPPTSFTTGSRGHCQNFEEKGFCMLGDVCPYDHGTDPVVVEDMSLPSVIPGAATTGIGSTTGFIPPDMRLPPPSHMGVRINLQRPPPPHVEPYLPEAPSLHKPPFMRVPPMDLRQPPPGMVPNRVPQQQDPFYLTRREVIINRPPPQAEEPDLLETIDAEKEPSRIVLPSKRPYSMISTDAGPLDLPPRPPGLIHVGPPVHLFEPILPQQPMFMPQIQPPPRRSFDYNRLGGSRMRGRIPIPRPQFRPGNLTLEVRKIPHEFNNISKLNEHFGKFGNLTNIQVKFQGDPGAALITFSNSAEANAAYRSPEPVFNNRFIKLFWHNSEKQINLDGETESPAVVGEEERDAHVQPAAMTGGRVGDGIDHPSLLLPVRPNIPPAHKLQLDNTKAKAGTSLTPSTPPVISEALVVGSSPLEKSIVYTSSVGNLKKTVFNSAASAANAAALAKAKTMAPFVSPLKSADHVSRMEAISRAEEERKLAAVKQAELEQKKQELLAKQIQQQKILLDTLEKKKATMSEEEKKELWKALRTISDSIDKIKYGTGAARKQPPPATPAPTFPTSTPAQFRYISGHEQQPFSYGRGRAWSARAPGWSGSRSRAHLIQSRTHLDNRPKTIEVKGFDLSEQEEIKHHFQTYGVIDKVDLVEEVPSMFLTYATRPSAEMAVSLGGKFKKKTLIVRWNQMTPKITRTESTQSSEVDEDLAITLGSLSEQSLSDFDSEDKVETTPSALFTIGTPNEQEKESQLLEEKPTETEPDKGTLPPKPALEDLFVAGEEHFKASYSDDEDDEDHITVTLSNTSSAPLKFSSEDGFGSSSNLTTGQEVEGSEAMEEDHSNFDSAALDYNDDGPWI